MTTVKQLLESKGSGVWTIEPDTSVFHALEVMAEKNVGALVVIEGESVAGIISERDYARKVILKGHASKEMRVADIMTAPVISVRQSQTIGECMELLTNMRVRHLPVIEDNRLLGIVSIGDVVKRIIADQQSTIEHLEDYITGRR